MSTSTPIRLQHRQIGFGEKFSFSYSLFAEQMLYQSFYPFSIFIVLLTRGVAAAYNMRFFFSCADPGSVVGFIIGMVIAVAFFIPVCLWPFIRAPTVENGGPVFAQVLDTEFSVLILVALFQRAAVSIKYSYMGSRYHRFMTTRLHSSETLSEQLLTGWMDIKPQLLQQEMDEAMRRIGLTHDDHFFVLPRRNVSAILRSLRCEADPSGIVPFEAQGKQAASDSPDSKRGAVADGELPASPVSPASPRPPAGPPVHCEVPCTAESSTSLLSLPALRRKRPEGAIAGDDLVAVRVSWLARALISRANSGAARMHKWLTRLLLVLSIVGALLPMVVRLCFSMPAFGYTPMERAALVCCALVSAGFNSVIGGYMRVGIRDYRRRTNSMRRLARLCSPDFREGRDLCRTSIAFQQPTPALPHGSDSGGAPTRPASVLTTQLPTHVIAAAAGFRPQSASSSSTSSLSSPRSSEHFTSNPMADAEAAAGAALHTGGGISMQQRRARGSAAVPSSISAGSPARPGPLPLPTATAPRSLLPNGKRLVVSQVIPLDDPGNALAFLLTRRLLLQFGGRFFRRVQSYQSLSLGMTLAIAVSLLASAIVNRGVALSQSAPTAVYAALSLFYFVVLMCLVLVCLRYGAIANSMAEEHSALLRARRLEVLQVATLPTANGDNEAAARSTHTAAVLDGVAATILSDASLEPVLIVGVPASFGLLRALAAGLLSVGTAVVKLLTD